MICGDTFPCVVSGRITSRAKSLMDVYGFTVRDAVEWYIAYKVDPKKREELDKARLKKQIYDLKLDLIVAEMELESLENGVEDDG